MSDPQNTQSEQAARWNGPSGQAWVDAQPVVDRLFEELEKRLVEEVAAAGAGHVLDVGCGTGGTTLAIARRLGSEGRCTGLDVSAPMIAAARARADREGVAASFILADAQSHPFEPAAFDIVVSRFGVMFFDDPVRAFANIRRGVRGGGALRCIAWRAAEDNPFMTTAERAAAPMLPSLPPRKPDAPGQFGFGDRDRVRHILADSGWSGVEIEPLDALCTMPASALHGYFTRFGPLGQVLDQAEPAARARIIETVRAAFDPFVHGEEVRFTAACWMIGACAPA